MKKLQTPLKLEMNLSNYKDDKVQWHIMELNCLKYTGCLDFQLHFQNCISKNPFMKSVDEKIIFINIRGWANGTNFGHQYHSSWKKYPYDFL